MDRFVELAFRRALENGDLDDLPGKGKPLKPSSLTTDPFAHVYAESETMTPIAALRAQIDAAKAKLDGQTDPDTRKALMSDIAALQTRLAVEMETWKRHT